jgi:hypothetical protein
MTEQGADHPDRDKQFRHINALVRRAMRAGQAVISVDKKKEFLGNFELDRRKHPPGRNVTKERIEAVNLMPEKFHGQGTTSSNHVRLTDRRCSLTPL